MPPKVYSSKALKMKGIACIYSFKTHFAILFMQLRGLLSSPLPTRREIRFHSIKTPTPRQGPDTLPV